MANVLSSEELLEALTRTGALLEGHFLLTSGLHSAKYMQCARLLQYPDLAERIGASIADLLKDQEIDLVAAPAIGGILVAHEVARALGVPSVFSEREGGVMTFRRGLGIEPGKRAVVVEDVITTGGSIKETINTIIERGGDVVATACIVDRSGGKVDLGYPLHALMTMEIAVYKPEACPLCEQGLELVKPGSRKLS